MKAVAVVLLLLVASVFSTKFIFQNPKISENLLQIMKQELAEGVDKYDVLVFMASTVDIKRYQQIENVDQRANILVNDMIHNAELSQESIVAELTAKKLQFKSYWISNVIAVKNCPVEVISWLATHPLVKRVESDKPAEVELPKPERIRMVRDNSSVEWNLEWLQATKVWEELNHWGENVTIAISDTGVHVTHPAIVKQYRGYEDGKLTHDYNWWDAGQKTSLKCPTKEPCDKAGHGSHCMGICLGSTEEHFYGMAPKAKFIGCRSIYDNTVPPSSYLECFQFLLAPTDSEGNNPKPDLRPHVITNSYRCGRCEPETLHDAVKALTAAGVMVVAAAGNDGSSCSSIIKPPGIYEEVFTVAASEVRKDAIAYFSSRGPITSDKSGRTKPDITAPGVNIISLRPPSGYTGMSGTSMATPHVAGAIALFFSAVPELKREVEKTRAIIQKSARNLESKACTSTGIPNNTYGYGMLQVYDAIQTAIKETRRK